MNKAFVREPDDTGPARCPRCDSPGLPVGPATVAAHLGEEARRGLAESSYFCPYGRCQVVYFDLFERFITTAALARPVYPKDPEAPICGCFGFTRDEIEQDVREGVVRRSKELLARSKSPEAQCLTKAASGQCCAGEVQRYYMKFRESWQARR